VKELVQYLLENLYLDFSGDISVDKVRAFLREDESAGARKLLARIIEDDGVDDLLLALADVLKEHLRTGINEKVVADELLLYSDS